MCQRMESGVDSVSPIVAETPTSTTQDEECPGSTTQNEEPPQRPCSPTLRTEDEGPQEELTYTSYVQSIVEFDWFFQFLRHEPGPFSVWGSIKGYPTRVTIVDNINGKLTFYPAIEVSNELPAALEARGPDVSTRVIIITYEHPWNCDRDVVKIIGKRFQINPRFFYGNFVYGDKLHIITPPTIKRRWTTAWTDPLPSQTISFELRQSRRFARNCNAFSAMVLDPTNSNCSSGNQTVVILVRDGLEPFPPQDPNFIVSRSRYDRWPDVPMPPRADPDLRLLHSATALQENTLSARYLSLLARMDTESRRAAEKHPIEYALPFGHILTNEFVKEFESWVRYLANERVSSMLEQWLQEIAVAKRNTSLLESTAAVKALADDINVLEERGNALLKTLTDALTQHVGLLSIEASRESISESHRVNKLTYAAFIFIPLSLITSVFGMNVSDLGSGPTPIWLPFAISAPLLAISIVYMWWASKKRHEKEKWKFRALSRLWRVTRFPRHLLLVFPVKFYAWAGLWVLKCIRHVARSRNWTKESIDAIEARMSDLIVKEVHVGQKSWGIVDALQAHFPSLKPVDPDRPHFRSISEDDIPSLAQRWIRNNMGDSE
ncbi:hypothetical protein BKA61DRAFT_345941 [Leptodontidium sp. MPI-SDFR-AT-0119]|nr:hypothetical protein BKA61DRAFT_345941 [Leptodontidium sp. MPI-SDFR-AT-0119]